MTSTAAKLWASSLLFSGAVTSVGLLHAPANAASCPASVLIDNAFTSSPFDCTLGDILYSFNTSTFTELTGATLFFTDGPTEQTLVYDSALALSNANISVSYSITSPAGVEILNVGQTYEPTSLMPTTNQLLSSTAFPFSGSSDLLGTFESAGTLTGLTQTIQKTPGPLPILGAAAAFGCSRKLRRRIKSAS